MITERPHGTRAKYVQERCRCFACRVANTNYQTEREARRRERNPWRVHHLQETGGWIVRNQLTGEIGFRTEEQREAYEARDAFNTANAEASDTPPLWADKATLRRVRKHLQAFQKAGVGLRQVAELTGVSRSRLTELANDTSYNASRPKQRWLKMETAERVLELEPTPVDAAEGATVPAAETWRLINELLAAGLRKGEIARALGRKTPALQIRKDRVLKRTETAVRELHDTAYRGSSRLRAVCTCPQWKPEPVRKRRAA